ncbi:glycerophosphodiester phosphodiesterase [Vibrio hepatarius]|uniref:glycerophosphodiester phosphodiesterase n=1 Tax=Vibrio hepatarius TaxID=171383 RepID=UPI00142D1C7C|nr:glycerophosphodiester phosphodiesterase family protein [Vibrio hepatarius]NIY82293.1 glycerophosphodiester phosphodiesterase [Vibrio hepatarius]NVJ57193.1 glycerophosphodiester phosphodiesterase [Vibrionaceae bacterium]
MTFKFNVTQSGKVLVNPHRGDCLFYPENTLPAFQSAVDKGVTCIEIDIAMTADNHLVVIHDPSIDRTSNGSGYVEQMSLTELQQFDFGAWFGEKHVSTPISTFEEILDWAINNGVGLVVEAKQRRRHEEFARTFVQLMKGKDQVALEHILLLSFDHTLINRVKTLLPEVALQVVTLARYQDQLGAVLASNAQSVCVEYPHVTEEVLMQYKQAGLSTRLFLPNKGNNVNTARWFDTYYGYDVYNEIISWINKGLIDMLSHDDIDMISAMIREAEMEPI